MKKGIVLSKKLLVIFCAVMVVINATVKVEAAYIAEAECIRVVYIQNCNRMLGSIGVYGHFVVEDGSYVSVKLDEQNSEEIDYIFVGANGIRSGCAFSDHYNNGGSTTEAFARVDYYVTDMEEECWEQGTAKVSCDIYGDTDGFTYDIVQNCIQ